MPAACDLGEAAVAVVEVEEIGAVELADVDVESAVVVDIGQGGAGFPGRASGCAGCGGNVLEPEGRYLAKELVREGLVDDVDIHQSVTVEIADRDTGADFTTLKLRVALTPHRRIVVGIPDNQARLGGRYGGELHVLRHAAFLGKGERLDRRAGRG